MFIATNPIMLKRFLLKGNLKRLSIRCRPAVLFVKTYLLALNGGRVNKQVYVAM